MAYAQKQYLGTGGIKLYGIPFPYISTAYVKLRIDGALLVPGVDYSWSSTTSISLTNNLPSGKVLDIRRETPKDIRLVDFRDASVLGEEELDLNGDQMFHVVQETLDSIGNNLTKGTDGAVDVGGARLKNVGEPVEDTDAATKGFIAPFVQTATEAASVASLAEGTTLTYRDQTEVFKNSAQQSAVDAEAAKEAAQEAVAGVPVDVLTEGDVGVTVQAFDSNTVKAAPGTAGNVLTSDGTSWASTAPAKITGDSVQMVYSSTGAVATGTTAIPNDDTIPQNTEGDQYLAASITPTSATNKLLVEVSLNLSTSMTGGNMMAALFQDSVPDSLSACMEYLATSDRPLVYSFNHYMTAGSTSAMTFKVRAGHEFGGTTTLNGIGGARKLGGVMSSSITVTEIKA